MEEDHEESCRSPKSSVVFTVGTGRWDGETLETAKSAQNSAHFGAAGCIQPRPCRRGVDGHWGNDIG
jgi:hypothetical protein